ncbi:YncE family protein [Halobacillus sp. A1]|uniref:YncE family protein n=1 Tax=Halobacillus sp. A1 TaxID=2880262 RepID=UPI0020A6D7CA|nr:YncE family protein [Halobacillus sp. A1]MCP3033344.1 YncE family protein [Halobacillus sp. A1]
MKKIMYLILLMILFLLTSCQEETVQIPENTENTMVVSHLKDNKLSFINEETHEVIHSLELDFTVADMVRINDSHISFTTKEEDDLYLLNLQTGKMKEWASVGSGVNDLLYNPEVEQLYLSDSKNNQIQVFDTDKEKIIEKVSVGKFPLSITADQKNEHLYVVNQQSSTVSVIDLNNFRVDEEFLVPHHPEGILVNDSKLYLGGHGPVHGELNRHIYVLDAQSGEQLEQIEVGLMPVKLFSPEVSPDLYVVSHGSHEVYKVSLENDSTVEKLKVGANPYEVTGDKEKLYVSNIDGDSISVIDPESFQVTSEIPVKGGPVSIVRGGGKE